MAMVVWVVVEVDVVVVDVEQDVVEENNNNNEVEWANRSWDQ